ncbi:MAG: class I SAM-dependent methyltransferase [Anaerolineales bacterium]|nr:class I SAM-dependent methyltransferase [Anaerolineales bacterium]
MNLNDPNYVKEQYRASDNLSARAALHERFRTAPRRWFDWYFDHLDLPRDARVLEIGCGTGALWRENRARVPATWQLTLTDFSCGMIETTRAIGIAADFAQNDAQAIPFRDASFDAVIANHMLYHVPDLPRALAEFRRVLNPGGKLFAATNGTDHMRELDELVAQFLGGQQLQRQLTFHRDNGRAILASHFPNARWVDYPDTLVVTETEPLVAYAMSGFIGKQIIGSERENALREFAAERIARDGAFRITKSTGLFIAIRR